MIEKVFHSIHREKHLRFLLLFLFIRDPGFLEDILELYYRILIHYFTQLHVIRTIELNIHRLLHLEMFPKILTLN